MPEEEKKQEPQQNTTEKPKETITDPNKILMTQAEYDAKQRKNVRDHINRFLRIIGLVAIIFVMVPCVEPIFRGSFLGLWMVYGNDMEAWQAECWNGNNYLSKLIFMGYDAVANGDTTPNNIGGISTAVLSIFYFIILVAMILGIVYILTYNIVDIILFFKGIGKAGKNIVKDYSDNVRYASKEEGLNLDGEKKPKKKKKSLFDDDEPKSEKPKDEPKKEERRKGLFDEVEPAPLDGYTDEQLDALLRGDPLPEKKPEDKKDEPVTIDVQDK